MTDNFKSVKEFSNLFSFEKAGDFLIGKFIKSYQYLSKTKKDEKGNPVEYTVHVVDQEIEGGNKEVQFFGAGALDHLLKEIKAGDRIKVVYEGLSPEEVDTAFGKKHIHQFDVLKAE